MSGHHHHGHDHNVGTVPLLAVAVLIAITVIGVAAKSLSRDRTAPVVVNAEVIEERALRFEDSAAGEVLVIDAATGETLETLSVGGGGFLRASLRGLARERRAFAVGDEVPFHIKRYDNGQLMLVDPVTNRHVDLVAFGPVNAGVFARYLAASTRTAETVQETTP